LVLIQSVLTALTGGRLRWHKLHRAGLTERQAAATAVDGKVAPEIDTWPSVRDRVVPSTHPAAGRATAKPAVLAETADLAPEDVPAAGRG